MRLGVAVEIPVAITTVVNPEELTEAIQRANLDPCQLSKVPLMSRLARVACPNVCLDFATFGPAMLFTGQMAMDSYTLVFVRECRQKGRSFNFQKEHLDGYIGFFPPGGLLDAYTPEGYSNVSLTVPEAEFRRALERSFPDIPDSTLKSGIGVRIGEEEHGHLLMLLAAVEEAIDDVEAPLASSMARQHLERLLLDAFLAALRSGVRQMIPEPQLRITSRLKHLQQARDYVEEHAQQPFEVDDLCQALSMSHRGVEMLFRKSFGITPNVYIKHQRLHGVRQALLTAGPRDGLVKECALKWGFWHLGHFARNYRDLFGESPSETLMR